MKKTYTAKRLLQETKKVDIEQIETQKRLVNSRSTKEKSSSSGGGICPNVFDDNNSNKENFKNRNNLMNSDFLKKQTEKVKALMGKQSLGEKLKKFNCFPTAKDSQTQKEIYQSDPNKDSKEKSTDPTTSNNPNPKQVTMCDKAIDTND